MDAAGSGRNSQEHEDDFEEAQEEQEQEQLERPRELPKDLPRTLDDRQNFSSYNQETEYYDAWQGVQRRQARHWSRDDLTWCSQANRNSLPRPA